MNDLNIIHTANKNIWELDLSNTLTYTIVIYNISNEVIKNVDIFINISKETNYVKNTLKLNGISYDYNYNNKIYIEKISPKENIVITFDVEINTLECPSVVVSFIDVTYRKVTCLNCTSYEDDIDGCSNTYVEKVSEDLSILKVKSKILKTPVVCKDVFIYHEIDITCAKYGDILEYKYIIKNNSTLNISDVTLENISNSRVEFIKNSLYINGINIFNNFVDDKISIGVIHSKETILIIFKAKIKKICNANALYNKGSLSFFYDYDHGYNHSLRFLESNELVLNICPNMTKSIHLSKTIENICSNPKIYQITDIFNYDIKIEYKPTLNQSPDDINNFFLTGSLYGRVTYSTIMDTTYENRMYIIEYEIPFKTEVLENNDLNEFVKLIPTIQFLDATLLENDRVYINVILDVDLIK